MSFTFGVPVRAPAELKERPVGMAPDVIEYVGVCPYGSVATKVKVAIATSS